MKCRYCGTIIPEGVMRCSKCGNEVRIVPDYNPLDDMLTAHIRGVIDEEERYPEENDRYRSTAAQRTSAQRSHAQRGNTQYSSSQRSNVQRNSSQRSNAQRNHTQRNSAQRSSSQMTPQERERRRRQAEKRKALKRKKRRQLICAMVVIFLAIVGGSVALYQNSYSGIVKKGYSAISKSEYDNAKAYFEKAIKKNEKKAKAYSGLAQVYMAKGDADSAEKVFLDAIEGQPENADIYEACVQFYIDSEQQAEIPGLLEDAEDSVLQALAEYVVAVPEYSLDEEETYDDVQEVSLTAAEGCTIYYTTNSKDPTRKSTKYSEPIRLDEGKTVVKAIAVNAQGIPSLPAKKTYQVELPMEDAPAVSPSTGQYTTDTQIEIKVPDGYEAYYTLDGTDPTTASTKYSEPFYMPEGETIFKAILVNKKGRVSGITTRNYVLEYEGSSGYYDDSSYDSDWYTDDSDSEY